MSYRIRVAFSMYDEDPTTTQPTVVSAYDEYTEEEWGKEPEFYTEAVQKAGGREKVRELDIHLAQSHIDARSSLYRPSPFRPTK